MQYFTFLLLTFLLTGCLVPPPGNRVCFKDQCVEVEVVYKKEDRQRGLQLREELGQNQGMLFLFENSRRHGFWMKETKIPLDIIWMDYTRRIVHIENQVPPCLKDPCSKFIPKEKALFVLEINAGHAKRWGLTKGDLLEFHLEDYLDSK